MFNATQRLAKILVAINIVLVQICLFFCWPDSDVPLWNYSLAHFMVMLLSHIGVCVWQMLLDEHDDTGVRDCEGLSPAMWMCRSDRIAHFELLSSYEQQQSADRQQPEHHDGIDNDGYERDLCGRTRLHWSVRCTEPLSCLKVCLITCWLQLWSDFLWHHCMIWLCSTLILKGVFFVSINLIYKTFTEIFLLYSQVLPNSITYSLVSFLKEFCKLIYEY